MFVDYGNVSAVSRHDLRKLPPGMASLPVQALRLQLQRPLPSGVVVGSLLRCVVVYRNDAGPTAATVKVLAVGHGTGAEISPEKQFKVW